MLNEASGGELGGIGGDVGGIGGVNGGADGGLGRSSTGNERRYQYVNCDREGR